MVVFMDLTEFRNVCGFVGAADDQYAGQSASVCYSPFLHVHRLLSTF